LFAGLQELRNVAFSEPGNDCLTPKMRMGVHPVSFILAQRNLKPPLSFSVRVSSILAQFVYLESR